MFQQYNKPNFSLLYSIYAYIQNLIKNKKQSFMMEINQEELPGPYDSINHNIVHYGYDGYDGYDN
jgi:hypothetical protein